MATRRTDPAREYGAPSLYVYYALRSTAIMTFFGSRMFLNLKEAGESKSKGGTSLSRNMIATISALRFADSRLQSG